MHRKATLPSGSLGSLLRLAARQHGVFTTAQAAALGVSRAQVERVVGQQVVVRRRRGIYVVAGSAATHSQRAMEAVLSGPDRCVASHQTAAHLHGLLPRPELVHVTVARNERIRADGVFAHRSVLRPSHVATIDAIPVTSLSRTVVDLASAIDLERFAGVLDPLVTAGRVRPERLLQVIDEIVHAPGRNGTVLLRTALAVWSEPMRPGSPAERSLWDWLRERLRRVA